MKNNKITNDKILIEITSSSEECEQLREDGLFFEAIADVLWIKKRDIKEINRE
ncbi:hypothetical protein HY750_02585 [Candidatus Kuenenbacteria bacterium]|nr:hypothetical protein [Candidatus Kuenenbacteria bacterium]